MHYEVIIKNKIYNIDCHIHDDQIFVCNFSINQNYRKRGYSRRILNKLQNKYKKPIYLECFPTLKNFYEKLGFEFICSTVDGYNEMMRRY